jgi:hypothetical protein
VLRFTGLDHLAAKQALDFVKGLKLPDGNFRDMQVVDPSGIPTQLYLNLDKNNKQRKLEGATRRLAALVISKYPHLKTKIFPRRSEGVVNCAFKVLATITVSPEATTLSWDPRNVLKHEIDMAPIKKEFLEEENIQWCS